MNEHRRTPTPSALLGSTGVLAFLVTSLLFPVPAKALDLTFYVAATVNFSQASVYRNNHQAEEADRANQRGYVFLALGLLVDVVSIVVLAATGADRVERLDAEIAQGGGPLTDAYSAAFGLSTDEVLSCMAEAVSVTRHAETSEEVDRVLLGRMLTEARMTDENAARLLYAFYEERSSLGTGTAQWHESLSELSSVPIDKLAPSIAGPIDDRLKAAMKPGEVLSARSVLAEDASNTLRLVLERVYEDHAATVDARIAEARPAAGL